MKLNSPKSRVRIGILCLTVMFFWVSFFPTYAEKTVTELENDVSDLNQKLENLEENLDDILDEINSISEELENTKEELAIAKGEEIAQYESMKLRIKYMYENGNFSFLEALTSSRSIAELVSRTEFYSAITEYDRKLLNELVDTQETIEAKEQELLETQDYLVALKKELDEKIASTSSQLSEHVARLEKAIADAEEAAKEEVEPVIPEKDDSEQTSKPSPGTTTKDPVQVTASDVELLAALLECEAGTTNYEGLLAVGSVVVNRMKNPYYPDTVRGVIFQSGQFPPALNGKVDRILERGVKPLCLQAAQDALNGKNNVGDCLSFRAASSGRPGIIIGGNVFF